MTRESCGRNGQLTMDEFVGALLRLSIGLTREQIRAFVRVYGGPGAEDADMCVCLYCVCVCARARASHEGENGCCYGCGKARLT